MVDLALVGPIKSSRRRPARVAALDIIGDSKEVGSDYRWPRDGDRLFVEASWSYDAQVVKDPKERFYRMPAGYSRAADLLVEQAALNIVDRNNIIYAALFGYRQSVELHLKRILLEFGSDNRQAIITHNLAVLWEQFIELVKAHDRGRAQDSDRYVRQAHSSI